MQLSKIKVIKKLGAGMLGTVYLINYENKIYAMKVQKIFEEEKTKNIKYPIWRELLFYKDVNKMPTESQKFFCKLYGYKIIENCNHTQIRPKILPYQMNFLEKINKSNICIILIIDYKGSTTLYDFLQKNIPKKQIYSILLQVCKIILILSSIKYLHIDLHPGNIMIHATKDETFEIMKNQIPHFGLQLAAIDYGSMTKYNKESYYLFKLTEFLFNIIQNKPKLEKNCRMQKKKYPYEKQYPIKYDDYIWNNILLKHEKIIDNYAKKYLKLYPYLEKFYLIFKKEIKNISISNISEKFKYKNEIKLFLLKILNNFAIDYPEEYMIATGWCSPPEYIIPKKDVLEILSCKTKEDYIKYFIKKIFYSGDYFK
jgi:serine/threonine protein kinase